MSGHQCVVVLLAIGFMLLSSTVGYVIGTASKDRFDGTMLLVFLAGAALITTAVVIAVPVIVVGAKP